MLTPCDCHNVSPSKLHILSKQLLLHCLFSRHRHHSRLFVHCVLAYRGLVFFTKGRGWLCFLWSWRRLNHPCFFLWRVGQGHVFFQESKRLVFGLFFYIVVCSLIFLKFPLSPTNYFARRNGRSWKIQMSKLNHAAKWEEMIDRVSGDAQASWRRLARKTMGNLAWQQKCHNKTLFRTEHKKLLKKNGRGVTLDWNSTFEASVHLHDFCEASWCWHVTNGNLKTFVTHNQRFVFDMF